MYELKKLDPGAVPAALARAERYRLLNEPALAESICLDVLEADPANQQALVMYILTLTDQFGPDPRHVQRAVEAVSTLEDEYERAYYTGVVWERRAKARFLQGGHGSHTAVYEWYREAMRHFEQAQKLRPEANTDALLRWNTCARFLNRHPEFAPRAAGEESYSAVTSE